MASLFDKIFRPDKAKKSEKALREARETFHELSAYTPVFTNWGGAVYESEIVRASIDAFARHISKLKVDIVGTANKPLQTKLKLAPNQFMTWSQFNYRVATIWCVNNNCFIVPVFDEDMVITGIYPVLPERCNIVEYDNELWLRYKFHGGYIGAVEYKKCALMTRHQYKSDFFGDEYNALKETMQLIHIQNQGIEEGIKNSATFRFMARLDNFSSAEDLAKERERFTSTNLSADSEAGGFLLFPNTYKDIKQVEVNPYAVDADQMKMIKENVFNYFGVNEDVLQNKAKGEELDAFFNGAIEPFSIQLSEALTMALFSEKERAFGTKVLVTANRLQYMSVAQKVQMAKELMDRGVMSVNEARELFNYEDVENGDTRFIRGEYYDTEDKITEEVANESE